MKESFRAKMGLSAFVFGSVAAFFLNQSAFAQDAGPTYEITITNLTRGQTFTPPAAVVHSDAVQLFSLGAAASPQLAALAEAGDPEPLADLLTPLSGVGGIAVADAGIPPGQTVTLTVTDTRGLELITVASMLVPTNDGFYALNGVAVPESGETVTMVAPAYDAGSEPNDEVCANVPGPPDVCDGEGFSPQQDGEGYVHIHGGIHGIADLVAADRDWRNPVAYISIRRTQ